jgi:hypothetical protein
MQYIHINNKELYRGGKEDTKNIYIDNKKYKIISFELATGDFIVEEVKDKPYKLH